MDSPRDLENLQRTINMLRLMLNSGMSAPNKIQFYQKFGTYGYALTIREEHIDYLHILNTTLTKVSYAFDYEMISRWKTINNLLIYTYRPPERISEELQHDFPSLAALVAFPLIEEVARRICNFWDEDGTLINDVPKSMGLFRVTSKGKKEPKTFKQGHRIVDITHKLVLMKSVLSEEFQKSLESLDARLSRSTIKGSKSPHITLFERIEYFRNLWSHGRRFEGIEAWLVVFLLAMLYFRIPQSEDDIKNYAPT